MSMDPIAMSTNYQALKKPDRAFKDDDIARKYQRMQERREIPEEQKQACASVIRMCIANGMDLDKMAAVICEQANKDAESNARWRAFFKAANGEEEGMTLQPTPASTSAVEEWLKRTENQTDEDMHEWAEQQGINTHRAEASVYQLADRFVDKQSSQSAPQGSSVQVSTPATWAGDPAILQKLARRIPSRQQVKKKGGRGVTHIHRPSLQLAPTRGQPAQTAGITPPPTAPTPKKKSTEPVIGGTATAKSTQQPGTFGSFGALLNAMQMGVQGGGKITPPPTAKKKPKDMLGKTVKRSGHYPALEAMIKEGKPIGSLAARGALARPGAHRTGGSSTTFQRAMGRSAGRSQTSRQRMLRERGYGSHAGMATGSSKTHTSPGSFRRGVEKPKVSKPPTATMSDARLKAMLGAPLQRAVGKATVTPPPTKKPTPAPTPKKKKTPPPAPTPPLPGRGQPTQLAPMAQPGQIPSKPSGGAPGAAGRQARRQRAGSTPAQQTQPQAAPAATTTPRITGAGPGRPQTPQPRPQAGAGPGVPSGQSHASRQKPTTPGKPKADPAAALGGAAPATAATPAATPAATQAPTKTPGWLSGLLGGWTGRGKKTQQPKQPATQPTPKQQPTQQAPVEGGGGLRRPTLMEGLIGTSLGLGVGVPTYQYFTDPSRKELSPEREAELELFESVAPELYGRGAKSKARGMFHDFDAYEQKYRDQAIEALLGGKGAGSPEALLAGVEDPEARAELVNTIQGVMRNKRRRDLIDAFALSGLEAGSPLRKAVAARRAGRPTEEPFTLQQAMDWQKARMPIYQQFAGRSPEERADWVRGVNSGAWGELAATARRNPAYPVGQYQIGVGTLLGAVQAAQGKGGDMTMLEPQELTNIAMADARAAAAAGKSSPFVNERGQLFPPEEIAGALQETWDKHRASWVGRMPR